MTRVAGGVPATICNKYHELTESEALQGRGRGLGWGETEDELKDIKKRGNCSRLNI